MILMVLRHGKAEKESPTGRDVDRALARKGEKQAGYIGERLARPMTPLVRPGVIISSRAARARATAEIVGAAVKLPVEFEDALLPDTTAKALMELVRRLAGAGKPALIVGHNPHFEDLVAHLTRGEEEMRTGELVVLDVRTEGRGVTAREIGRERLGGDD